MIQSTQYVQLRSRQSDKVNRVISVTGYFRLLSRYAQRKQGLDFADRYAVAKCCLYMHSTIVLAENVALVFLY